MTDSCNDKGMEMNAAALDRHITGNYGEDFFSDDETEETDDTEAEWRYDRDEDRIREDAHLEQDFEDRYAGGEFDYAD